MNDPYKEKILNWQPGDEVMPQSTEMERWFKGDHFNYLPTKPDIRESGLDSILTGWLPERPIIEPTTRVIALGSCFARYFILWLAEHGFNQTIHESPYNALLRFGFGFESASVIAQQFRWAFGEFDSKNALWFDTDKSLFEATEERRKLVFDTLTQTDVLIVTLGLSEVWYDNVTNESLWRTLPETYYDPNRHVFRVESLEDTLQSLETIHRIRESHLPNLRIVFTVSPVRLKGTFRPISAFVANTVSKSILRAALDEFLRNHEELLNRTYFYYPSYEMVTEIFREPFREDNRHLYDYVPKRILSLFARHYTTYEADEQDIADEKAFLEESHEELHRVIEQLETKVNELQQECDKRHEIIQTMNQHRSIRSIIRSAWNKSIGWWKSAKR